MVAILHSNGQLRTERGVDTKRGYQKPALQQKTTDGDEYLGVLLCFYCILKEQPYLVVKALNCHPANHGTMCLMRCCIGMAMARVSVSE